MSFPDRPVLTAFISLFVTLFASADNYVYLSQTNRLLEIESFTLEAQLAFRSYSYDARGNMVGEDRGAGVLVSAEYDGHGRLASYARSGEGTLSHSYNGLDDRVATITTQGSASATQRFVYDGAGRILGEYGASSSELHAEFIWLLPDASAADASGGFAPLAVAVPDGTAGTELAYVYGNHLGVPLVTSDASGNAIAPATTYNAPGFPGQTRTFADLYYNRYRDYDPNTGRYIQADPIGLAGGANPYLYALNNPLKYTDPTGKCPVCLIAVPFVATAAGSLVGAVVEDLAGIVNAGFAGKGSTAAETKASVAETASEVADEVADDALITAATGGAAYAAPRVFGTAQWLVNRVFRRGGLGNGCVEVALTGQMHHGISRTVHNALERHPNLAGVYSARDSRFVTQAKDLASHMGYDKFHRGLDNEISVTILGNPQMTSDQFENYLREVYRRPDVTDRFPGGL